jgi:two-component system, sensor histidine kinase RegB
MLSSTMSRGSRNPTPFPPSVPHPDSVLDNATWLLRLRWVAIAGQLVTIALVITVWKVTLRVEPLLVVISLTAVTNLLFHWWLHRQRLAARSTARESGEILLVLTMLLDLISLTALLYFSGGPTNPFITFYLVNLALAAILLPSIWSWVLTALAIFLFDGFFIWGYVPIPELEGAAESIAAEHPWVRRQGLIAAFAACAVVNCYFITRVSKALQQREAELRRVEKQQAASERLEALATLAAGAGHELASPLSTIAVIANDLARHLEGAPVPDSVIEDMSLIRSELAHCRSILDRMSGNAGQAVGEQVGSWKLERILEEVISGLRRSERVRVEGLGEVGELELFSPLQGLAQALRGLVQNGLDASTDSDVVIRVSAEGDEIQMAVIDQGQGMSPEELARAGEPFFTTKEPGQGMGLGLFLTRNVIERLGGILEMQSELGQGTTALVRLPVTRRPSRFTR